MNPANDAPRGLSAEAIIVSNRWTKGPEFLWLSEEKWPQVPVAIEEEVKQKPLEVVATTLAINRWSDFCPGTCERGLWRGYFDTEISCEFLSPKERKKTCYSPTVIRRLIPCMSMS